MADVLIVGAGPVGLALGCALQLNGVQVEVLEARLAPQPESRASHVHGRVLELLDTLGATSSLVGRPTWGARIVSDGRVLVEFRSDSLQVAHPYSLAVPQPELESALEARLQALGGTVSRGVQVEGVDPTGEVRLKGGRMRAPWVVGCDGAASTVRTSLGLPLPGVTQQRPLALADFDTAPEHRLPVAELHCGPRGLVFRVPLREGERVVIDQPPEDVDAAQIAQIARSRVGELPLGEPRWASSFRLHRRVAPRWRLGRVLLAGDAVHLHSPVGGQGMNAGLLDAMHLGWRLAAVVRGHAREAVLDQWVSERRESARESVDMAWLASRMLSTQWRSLCEARDLLLRASGRIPLARARMAGWGVALDNDATSVWSRQLGAPPWTVGARAPYLPGFPLGQLVLVHFGAPPHALAPHLSERYGQPVAQLVLPRAPWQLALVRPDGLVAYRGGPARLPSALEALLS